jgi:serine/threonine protein kinase
MMYELLTGRVPFEGDNWMAVMQGHLQRTPARIRELRPEVSPALEGIVLRAMRRYPDNRYQSAHEILSDLDQLDSASGPAPSPSLPSPSVSSPSPSPLPSNGSTPTPWTPSLPAALRPNPAAFDLSPEAPMGGMAAAGSTRRLWGYVAAIALGFIAAVALILTLTIVLR